LLFLLAIDDRIGEREKGLGVEKGGLHQGNREGVVMAHESLWGS
jgi:hypothetical protein